MISLRDPLFKGYLGIIVFFVGISVMVLIRPRISIQAILLLMALVIMLIGGSKFQDLLAGIILHPIMAMATGFLVAGALDLAGGFDALIKILMFLAQKTPLGLAGVAVVFANIPTITPMPCGRILSAALVPGVVKFAYQLSEYMAQNGAFLGIPPIVVVPSMIGAFIVNAAASCGPSPLGGIGGIGEGNLAVRIGISGYHQQCGIMVMTAVCALIISFTMAMTFVKWFV